MKTIKHFLQLSAMVLLLAVNVFDAGAQGPYPSQTTPHLVCLNSTEPYGVVLTDSSSYTWSINDPTAGIITVGDITKPNLINVNWGKAGNYKLQVVETNKYGCVGAPVTIDVTVNELPTVSITGNNGPLCYKENAVFNLSGTANAEVTYTINGGANQTVTLNGSGTATVTVSAATANQTLDLVSVRNTTTNCSQAISGSSTIIVYPQVNTSPIYHN